MSKIFTRTFRVRWSELNANGQVSPGGYLRYLVETAYDWGDALGLGEKDVADLNITWLIRETELHLVRPLRHNDVFDFTIWMVNWQRVRGMRCFEIHLKDSGERIAWGTQQIVCMDRKSLRPTTLPDELIDNFKLDEPRVLPFERFPRLAPPKITFISKRTVAWDDLDAMEHVNNAIYVSFAEEAAAQELAGLGWPASRLAERKLALAVHRLHIQYQSPAVWGEELTIATHTLNLQANGGTRYVKITRADEDPVAECVVDWKLINREDGAEQPLPAGWVERLAR